MENGNAVRSSSSSISDNIFPIGNYLKFNHMYSKLTVERYVCTAFE